MYFLYCCENQELLANCLEMSLLHSKHSMYNNRYSSENYYVRQAS